MDRLTRRIPGAVLLADDIDGRYTANEVIDMLAERLADYEETGLTPEDIKALLIRCHEESNSGADAKMKLYFVTVERDAMAAELKARGGCDACKYYYFDFNEEPCDSCRNGQNYPAWEWKGEGKC